MNKENQKNKKKLITLLKDMKRKDKKSQVVFMLGAGFSKHVYNIPLWNDLAENYTKDKFKYKYEKVKLSNFETQLIIDYSEKKDDFYTRSIDKSQIEPHNLGFKKFYDQIKTNKNILTKFITTNHCQSIKKYFNINQHFSFDVKDIYIDLDKFKKIYNENEIIINLHGSLENKTQIIKTDEYHELFLKEYKNLFNLFKEIENNEKNKKQNIVIVFGSSMEEKHLISFITHTYDSNNDNDSNNYNFYINHNKIKSKIYSILNSGGFNYISTCIKNGNKNNCIDECNNLFFMNIEERISGYYSPKNSDLQNYYDIENKNIINEITKIENYVFGKTFKQIDKIINQRVSNDEIPFKIFNKNHFLSVFLWKKEHENIGKYVVNLYLYYFEKDQDFWNIFEMEDVFKNEQIYFKDFLKYILINDKFKLEDFLNNYMNFSFEEKKWMKVFNDFFSNLNNFDEKERYLILTNFFRQINGKNTLINKDIYFIKKLNKFKIEIDYERFIKEFKINDKDNKYKDFVNIKKFIIFTTHFFEINNFTNFSNIIENLIPDLKLISKIDFEGSDKILKNENIIMYLDDFDFMQYIWIPYLTNDHNITLSSFEEFDPDNEFDSLSTNFLLNYYSSNPDYSIRINKLLNNRKYKGKIWKFPKPSDGIVRIYNLDRNNEKDKMYYKEKWETNSIAEILKHIEKETVGYIENENEKIEIIKEKLSKILETKDWIIKIKDISKTFFEFEKQIQKSPWSEWNFFVHMVIAKYVKVNEKISILELDEFLLNHFEEEYLNGQHMEKFNNLIKLDMIEWSDFSKMENIKSTFLVNQLFDLLNINSGNIFYIFGEKFKTNNDNPQSLYFLKIWQQIFDNSKDLPKIIERIIDSINSDDQNYKNNLRKLFENVFSDNSINTWKKGLYYLFDSFSPEDKKFYEQGDWKFRDDEFDDLNNFLENLSYQSKNSNIKFENNSSRLIFIRRSYKELFFIERYDETNLFYKMIFNDKETLIASGRKDFILFELKIIYRKFYDKDKKEFNMKITKYDFQYLWQIFMKLSNFDLKNENVEMLKNIHNSLKKEAIPKKLIPEEYSKLIKDYIIEYFRIDRAKKEPKKIKVEFYKFKFCLLSLTKDQLLKEIRTLKDHHFYINNYEKIIENISTNSDDILCKEHSS